MKYIIYLNLFPLLFLAGCMQPSERYDFLNQMRPPYEVINVYSNEDLEDPTLRRLVFLPLSGGGVISSDALCQIDHAFYGQLLKGHQFEVLRAYGEFPPISSCLPDDFLSGLRQSYGADVVLFCEITHYHPYPPMKIGVKCRLVELLTGQTIWAVDEIFDAGEASVRVAAKNYESLHSLEFYPINSHDMILKSPSKFAEYVAKALFKKI